MQTENLSGLSPKAYDRMEAADAADRKGFLARATAQSLVGAQRLDRSHTAQDVVT
jgi:hypothetical protein